jgi:hypothetical protein
LGSVATPFPFLARISSSTITGSSTIIGSAILVTRTPWAETPLSNIKKKNPLTERLNLCSANSEKQRLSETKRLFKLSNCLFEAGNSHENRREILTLG